jgi:inosine-uridine nucleoside N-ribohydrolase
MEGKRIPLWLDCDPGNDDTFAIILAGTHPKINLLGVSTMFGNAGVEATSLNACKVLHAAGIDGVNVLKGASQPLCEYTKKGSTVDVEEIHGVSGLGTKKFPTPPTLPLKDNAILYMYNTIMKSPDKVKLVGTGALTNIALLLKTFPDVKQNIDEVVFMGGSIYEGNITPSAEFNVICDPEAADIVCHSGAKVVMVPLEVTHTTMVTKEVKERIRSMKTTFTDSCLELLDFYADGYLKTYGFDACPLHDPTAVAYCIAPELFKTEFWRVDIDRFSERCRGRTICDKYNVTKQEKNVHVATTLDVPKFWDMMIGAIEVANAQNRCDK